jgi:hypothetical protein
MGSKNNRVSEQSASIPHEEIARRAYDLWWRVAAQSGHRERIGTMRKKKFAGSGSSRLRGARVSEPGRGLRQQVSD